MADLREQFGALIREQRLAHQPNGKPRTKPDKQDPMTQEDLAELVGVHQPSVSAWELGKTLPAPGTLLRLAGLFNLDLAVLGNPKRRNGQSRTRKTAAA